MGFAFTSLYLVGKVSRTIEFEMAIVPDPQRLDHIRILRSALREQTRMLDQLIAGLQEAFEQRTDERAIPVCVLMIQSLGVSIHSVLRLSSEKGMAIRDCFGIARSATELAVNICYIAAGGDDVVKRAERHALQKTYRDLERSGEVGGTSFRLEAKPRTPLDEFPELAEAIAEFTGKNGKEIADWTPLSISKQIDVVREANARAGLSLSGATIAIYRHASEFLHGTYFSVLYFWHGIGDQRVTRESFLHRWDGHFAFVFGALFFSASGVVEFFAKKYSLSQEIVVASQELSKEVEEALKAMDASLGA